MISREENNRKQQPSTSPSSIGLKIGAWLKFGAVALGLYLWGTDFIWALICLYFGWNILRGILSCLVSLLAVIGFFYFLFTHIF